MSIVTITINNKNFQLSCADGSEETLQKLASLFNDKTLEIRRLNPSASFELVLVMASLSLQDKLIELQTKIDHITTDKPEYEDEKFAETLSTIAGYLENLAQKLGK